jgi:hypothetical protein
MLIIIQGFIKVAENNNNNNSNNNNSVALAREQTIPTEQQPLVGEVSANFCGEWVSRG